MSTLLQTSINISAFNILLDNFVKKPVNFYPVSRTKTDYFHQNGFKLKAYRERWSFVGGIQGKYGILTNEEGRKRKKRVVAVKFNQGFGFNGGGGGGGDNNNTARIVGNLALAAGLTYLSVTGQLGWFLDAIVSIWLLAVLVPIVGLGAFIWWAGRDIVQSTCPNCGNDFQIFKSALNEDLQLCPFCTQPFSVVENKFVRDSVKFSNEPKPFGQAFKDVPIRPKKGKDFSTAIVDVEAEIKDAD